MNKRIFNEFHAYVCHIQINTTKNHIIIFLLSPNKRNKNDYVILDANTSGIFFTYSLNTSISNNFDCIAVMKQNKNKNKLCVQCSWLPHSFILYEKEKLWKHVHKNDSW